MAILSSQEQPGDLPATVWDLAEGFAALAATVHANDPNQRGALLKVAARLRDRFRRMERQTLALQYEGLCNHLSGEGE